MRADPQRALDLTTAALLRELGDEVDLIFRFGSLLKGTAHAYSDIDVAYVPAHDGTGFAITVLVEDTLLDLFPLHWSRLEKWAAFEDPRGTVILEGEVLYARDETAAARWQALVEGMRALLHAEARPEMVRRALTIFETTGYPYLLLHDGAAAGNRLACRLHVQQIRDRVAHAVAVANQTAADTRKLDQLLALPSLPDGFEAALRALAEATAPSEMVAATDVLLRSTRAWLLAEQRRTLRRPTTMAAEFADLYPEWRGMIQHVMLACEREDVHDIDLATMYLELMQPMARARTGVVWSSFNSLADYEQDLAALGFPPLLPYLEDRDFARLRAACVEFDARLRALLAAEGVSLNEFASVAALASWLGKPL